MNPTSIKLRHHAKIAIDSVVSDATYDTLRNRSDVVEAMVELWRSSARTTRDRAIQGAQARRVALARPPEVNPTATNARPLRRKTGSRRGQPPLST